MVDKWFTLQATSRLPQTLAEVQKLTRHPAFTLKNPNRVRALVGAFAQGNPARFHAADGAGYRFLADQVLALDPRNPQVAARLLIPLSRWRRYDAGRQALMKGELARIAAAPDTVQGRLRDRQQESGEASLGRRVGSVRSVGPDRSV